jgi:hypothetical protein
MKRMHWLLLTVAVLFAAAPGVARALPFLAVDHQATSDVSAAVDDHIDNPGPVTTTARVGVAASIAAAVKGPEYPLPLESGTATATAVTLVIAQIPTNKVSIRSAIGIGMGARSPYVSSAQAESYGNLTLLIGPDKDLSLGDPMFVELEFLVATSVFDAGITGSRSYRLLNATLGTVLFDSATGGFPSDKMFFSAHVGDHVEVQYALSLSGSTDGLLGTDHPEGDMILRSTLRAVAVPEPSSALLLGAGVAGLAFASGRRRVCGGHA